MSVTLKDIADRLSVSKMTVSRVLNNRSSDFITQATRRRVMETARVMGYTPNRAAQALATGQTRRIAFLSPSMGLRFFQEVANRFHQILLEDRYEIVSGELDRRTMGSTHPEGLARMGLDGVLMYGGGLGSFVSFKGPIVNMGPHCSEKYDAVNVDLYPASRRAVESLLDSGAKRVAHVLTPSTQKELDDRYRGYTGVMRERGKETEYILTPDWSRASARQTIQDYVKEHGCPDGLFCANDDIAIGTYRGLRDMGISIPEQVRLIGCDGIEDTEYLDPPLSTIVQPFEDMCATAWRFLKNRLKKGTIPRQAETLEARLMMREQMEELSK
ncbi:MAG: LacI family DNA-binding transcriptional regulator [Phycisphaerae bacterium]|nr:LacI family DNA-binding transcriptional regulator [Phycisphaerae bacterium]